MAEMGSFSQNENRTNLTFDGDALPIPQFLEPCQRFELTDTDHVLFEVELLGVEAEQAAPQLAHRLVVFLVTRPLVRLQREQTTYQGQI